jgi:hypothetical protein
MRDIRLETEEEMVSPYQALGYNRGKNELPDKIPEEEKRAVDEFFVSGGESLLSKVRYGEK